MVAVFGHAFTDPPVSYAATQPGPQGPGVAFLAELAISAVLMLVLLTLASSTRYARFAGFAAGCLVAAYISFESPLSGMSMNPARSFASAAPFDKSLPAHFRGISDIPADLGIWQLF